LTGSDCAPARRTHGPIAALAAASPAVPMNFRRVTSSIMMFLPRWLSVVVDA
jgi:hypothetical protein